MQGEREREEQGSAPGEREAEERGRTQEECVGEKREEWRRNCTYENNDASIRTHDVVEVSVVDPNQRRIQHAQRQE